MALGIAHLLLVLGSYAFGTLLSWAFTGIALAFTRVDQDYRALLDRTPHARANTMFKDQPLVIGMVPLSFSYAALRRAAKGETVCG
jgi:hypothetical protein